MLRPLDEQYNQKDWDYINLCCDKHYNECKCAFKIPSRKVYKLDYDPYKPNTKCEECKHYRTVDCPMLRLAAKYLEDFGVTIHAIEPCNEYEEYQGVYI